jgi:hypothetical protein
MPVPQRVCFFVVVCSHLEQARCLFHKESVFLWDGPESPSLWGPRNRVFFPKDALHRVNSVKNPVSLSECVQDCLNPDKYKELGKLD